MWLSWYPRSLPYLTKGQHESVSVSFHPDLSKVGPFEAPTSVPSQKGIPKAVTDLTVVVPFNSPEILENRIKSLDAKVACVIMEPVMLNCGVILPEEGYLQKVREICDSHSILLVFDEVKTNLTIG